MGHTGFPLPLRGLGCVIQLVKVDKSYHMFDVFSMFLSQINHVTPN